MPKQMRPYGTWNSPISIRSMSGSHRLYDMQWDTSGDVLVWHERRASGSALVVQFANRNPYDLLRDESIGGGLLFGGGGFTIENGTVYFVGKDGRIYRMPVTGGIPKPITPAFGSAAHPAVSPDERWLAYVHSYEGRDCLALVPTDGSAYPIKLLDTTDFVMQPMWHPYGDRIACVTWNHPNMPWNESKLHLLYLSSKPHLHTIGIQVVAGKNGGESIFGAAFSPDSGYLAYSSDRSGWWQLYLYDLDLETTIQLTDDLAEYAVPAWLQGMRTFSWAADSRSIYALRNANSNYSLRRIAVEAGTQEVVGGVEDYTHLEQITVSPVTNEIAMIGGSSVIPDRLITVDPLTNAPFVRAYSSVESIHPDYLSTAMDIIWESEGGVEIHGLYYPPTNPNYESGGVPPLIVYIHSGPTRQRFARYFPQTQFFTSRGFAVLEPNYRGSTGYGKALKDMLHGNWGVADIIDAANGAEYLVSRGMADQSRLVVMGESSGGFSVLQSLILMPNLYRAGIAQAPVTDQFGLAKDTHKFEQHYSDSLIGKLPDDAQAYRERSPLFHADQIQTPVAIFHGKDDNVVPVEQSEAMAATLRRKGVPHVFKVYEGEGHSFRKSETITDYYETVMDFLLKYVIYA